MRGAKYCVSANRVGPSDYWGFATNTIFRPSVAAKTKVQWAYDPTTLSNESTEIDIILKTLFTKKNPTSTLAFINRKAYKATMSASAPGKVQLATWTVGLGDRKDEGAKFTPEERQKQAKIIQKFISSAIMNDYFLISDTKLVGVKYSSKLITKELY